MAPECISSFAPERISAPALHQPHHRPPRGARPLCRKPTHRGSHRPTLSEPPLMRPYLSVLSARIRMLLQYRAAALAGMSTQLFWGLIRVMIFRSVLPHGNPRPQPMTYAEVVNYVWLGQALFALLPWHTRRRRAHHGAHGHGGLRVGAARRSIHFLVQPLPRQPHCPRPPALRAAVLRGLPLLRSASSRVPRCCGGLGLGPRWALSCWAEPCPTWSTSP